MNIKRVKYKMDKKDDWNVGYVIGAYEGQNKVLLNCNFEYVPKIIEGEKEYLVYDMRDDLETYTNITITI